MSEKPRLPPLHTFEQVRFAGKSSDAPIEAWRLRVAGGWIYRLDARQGAISAVFVPDGVEP